jgi:excisionase family DNA binding protein
MSATTQPLLVSAREAAEMLGVSARTVAYETAAGRLPSVRVRTRRLYRIEALTKYAEQNESADASVAGGAQ